MGKDTKISWCHHSFNPWHGCTKIATGCSNCYAERFAARMGWDIWGPHANRRLFWKKHWKEPLVWNAEAERAGERRRVFCGSMCDVFEHIEGEMGELLDRERERLWNLIEQTPNLDWLLLTKRPHNILRMLPPQWVYDRVPPNTWWGVSASTQAELEENWAALDSATHRRYPLVLFASLEPLLEHISIEDICQEIDCGDEENPYQTRGPDWIIVGAESGPGRRLFLPGWAKLIYEECDELGVPFFGKQDSDFKPGKPLLIEGREIKEFPGDCFGCEYAGGCENDPQRLDYCPRNSL